jgi:hypothetical protein
MGHYPQGLGRRTIALGGRTTSGRFAGARDTSGQPKRHVALCVLPDTELMLLSPVFAVRRAVETGSCNFTSPRCAPRLSSPMSDDPCSAPVSPRTYWAKGALRAARSCLVHESIGLIVSGWAECVQRHIAGEPRLLAFVRPPVAPDDARRAPDSEATSGLPARHGTRRFGTLGRLNRSERATCGGGFWRWRLECFSPRVAGCLRTERVLGRRSVRGVRHLLPPSGKPLAPATTPPCRLGTFHGSLRGRACQVRPRSGSRATPTCTGHRPTGPPGKTHMSPCGGSTRTRRDPGTPPRRYRTEPRVTCTSRKVTPTWPIGASYGRTLWQTAVTRPL